MARSAHGRLSTRGRVLGIHTYGWQRCHTDMGQALVWRTGEVVDAPDPHLDRNSLRRG